MSTTAQLHASADQAAQRGAFREALAHCAEILHHAPGDFRARLKAGLCLAALGRADDGAAAVVVTAKVLARQGFGLAALGACRDALGLSPGHSGAKALLERLADAIVGVEGQAVPRVPPPITPEDLGEATAYPPEAPDVEERARVLAMTDPGSDEDFPTHPVPFFSDLSRAVFLDLVPRMRFAKLPGGAPVVAQGAPGDSLYVVVSGEVSVTRQDDSAFVELARLTAGKLFGEMSLLTQKVRAASVSTVRPTELFEIGRSAVEAVAREHPPIVQDLVRFARRRLIENLLATSPVFAPLEEPQKVELVSAFETQVASKGQVIIEEGQDPVGLYLVLEGEVQVTTVDADGDGVVLAYLREGEVVGEIGLVETGQATATVTASERSVLLHLPKAKLEEVTAPFPEVVAYLKALSVERLTEMDASSAAEAIPAEGLILM